MVSQSIIDINQQQLTEAEASFLAAFPAYHNTPSLDKLRETEYARLDANQQIYLDYTGGGLYAQSQLDAHFEMLKNGVWGNPHSQNPTSLAMTERVEHARAYVLKYFNADPDEYDVIFTPNASGALKIVGESFPFTADSRYMLIFDNHNSVNGIREFARAKGAEVQYIPTRLPDLRLHADDLMQQLEKRDPAANNLFAYTAQSNFSGVQHDLDLIQTAQELGWHVLLDAAAYVPTNRLDLSEHHPDFVTLSFYKMFGYPTGLGCLIARKSALSMLQRPWFAGGTITITSVQGAGWHYLIEGHAAFEDGTVNYLNIPAVETGLKHIEAVGIEHINTRVKCLTGWLLQQMSSLKHDNGKPVVTLYGPLNTEMRGGTIAFNVEASDGTRFDYRRVEMLGNKANISLRTGCFCNPGSGEIAHQLTQDEMAQIFSSKEAIPFDDLYELVQEQFQKYPSTIRISVGIATNFNDVYTFMAFLEQFKNRPAAEINALPINKTHTPDTA